MSKVLAIAQFGFGALDMLEETLSQFMLSTFISTDCTNTSLVACNATTYSQPSPLKPPMKHPIGTEVKLPKICERTLEGKERQ